MSDEKALKRNLRRRSNGWWYAVFYVPAGLQDAVGRREIVRALGTKDLHDANARKREVLDEIERSLAVAGTSRTTGPAQEPSAGDEELRGILSLNRNILMSSMLGIAAYRNDGQCVLVNPQFAALAGGTEEQIRAQNFYRLATWKQTGLLVSAERTLKSGENVERELHMNTTFGQSLWLQYQMSRFVSHGRFHLLLIVRDVTRTKQDEEQLRLAASVFHNSAEGVMVTDASGLIISVNPAFTKITGYSEAEALGQGPRLLRSERHDPEFYRSMWDSLSAKGHWKGEIWNRRKDGDAYLEMLSINRIEDEFGRVVRYVAVFHDITDLRRKDEHIHYLAFHDGLTGLANRTMLQDRLMHALERAEREGLRLAVAFIDLDGFKAINDELGHDAGDILLQTMAQRIKSRLRTMDTLARMGGDEFVVLMEDVEQPKNCAKLAETVLAEISVPTRLKGRQVVVTASMGMAFYPEDGTDATELMRLADFAMYAAKEAGRNAYRFFQQGMMDKAKRRLTLEMELRAGIANGELVLHYQPKIDLVTQKPGGAEALIRWQHPRNGLLSPGLFIPMAEESGLVVEIGSWVLEEACRQIRLWNARGLGVKVAVNVSARQLEAMDLADHIADLTARHGISPKSLELELTESAVMANVESVIDVFTRLREMGVSLAIDDFGTGYSSLAYLRRLPIDVIKIDRSFVIDSDMDVENAEIVRTILALGKALKLTVVAEGIETPRQAEFIRSVGVDLAQGYLYARPLAAAAFEEWMAREI